MEAEKIKRVGRVTIAKDFTPEMTSILPHRAVFPSLA